ncbi:MAG: helix-turn-helix domain-containing protein [Burkholderiales bacterium]
MTELHQMTLDEIARSRRTDPQTSRDAARRAHGLASEHCATILRVLRAAGAPLSPDGIAVRCSLSSLQVSRRLRELVDAGAIVEAGVAPTPSGRSARTWRPTP